MHSEMIMRDRNRCALTFWGIANETSPSKSRNSFLKEIINNCQKMDTTRLLTAAFDKVKWNGDTQTFELEDTLTEYLDVVSINKYMGGIIRGQLSRLRLAGISVQINRFLFPNLVEKHYTASLEMLQLRVLGVKNIRNGYIRTI